MRTIKSLAALFAAALALAPAAAEEATLPVDMHGTWGWDDEACGDRVSDGRVAITGRTVEFFASAYALDDPKPTTDGGWGSRAQVFEEGEEETSEGEIELRLVGADEIEIRTGGEAPSTYIRCADDLPVR